MEEQSATIPRQRWWESRRFAVLAMLLAALPLVWPTIPPLADLPGHIARYHIMAEGDAGILSQWYSYTWKPAGNLGVDLLVYALAPLAGVEFATKLVILAIPALTVGAMLWLSREAHGRVDPLALFALPIAYNYSFHFGFVNYALGMALAIGAFALWLRLARLDRIALRALAFVPLASIVWLTHLTAWGTLGLFAFAAEVVRQRSAGRDWPAVVIRAGLGCLPLTLPIVFMIVWRSSDPGYTLHFFQMVQKAGWIVMIFRDRWLVFDLASLLLLFIVFYRSLRDKRSGHAQALSLAAALLLIAFLVTPYMLMGSAFADTRLAPFVVAMAVLALRTGPLVGAREQMIVAMIGLAFFGGRIVATSWSFALYDRSWTGHLAALDHVPRGVRVVSFTGEGCLERWGTARNQHLPGMLIARRAAFTNTVWKFASAPLKIEVTGIDGFARDPSQIVQPTRCEVPNRNQPIAEMLRRFPRHGFDYVWLIDLPSLGGPLPADLRPVWRNGTDWLLVVDHQAPGPRSYLSSSPTRP